MVNDHSKEEFNPAAMILLLIFTLFCPLVGMIAAAVNWKYYRRQPQCVILLGVGVIMMLINVAIILAL